MRGDLGGRQMPCGASDPESPKVEVVHKGRITSHMVSHNSKICEVFCQGVAALVCRRR